MGLINNQPFTCSNARFETDVKHPKGKPHGEGHAGGSVFPAPLTANDDGTTLWLEYVKDKHGQGGWDISPLWLMWYDKQGSPTISQSATFDFSHLREILARFIA